MVIQLHVAHPSLLLWPHIFWQAHLHKALRAISNSHNYEINEGPMRSDVDIHVFQEVRSVQMESIANISGLKILICAEAAALCPDSQKTGIVFNRKWDQVFTWNTSYKSANVQHFEWLSIHPQDKPIIEKNGLSNVFLFYAREKSICLPIKKKIERATNLRLVSINLSSISTVEAELIEKASVIYQCDLSWYPRFRTKIETRAQERGVNFFKIGWHPSDIQPLDSISDIQFKMGIQYKRNPEANKHPNLDSILSEFFNKL